MPKPYPREFRDDVVRFFEKEIQRIMDLKGVPIIIRVEGKKKDPNRKTKRPKNSRPKVRRG